MAEALGLEIAPESHWARVPARSEILLGTRTRPLLARFDYGKGEVWGLAAARSLENAGLAQQGLPGFFPRLLLEPARPVWFDEFRHGIEETPGLAYILDRYGLVPSTFALLAFLALAAWKISPRESVAPPPARTPVEVRDSLIDVRGSLYARTLRPAELATLLEKDFRHGLSQALGEHRPAGWPELGRKVASRLPGLSDRFQTLLTELDRARRTPPERSSGLLPLSRRLALFLQEVR